jgi:formate/nitrite transporter FocA (FNT family)
MRIIKTTLVKSVLAGVSISIGCFVYLAVDRGVLGAFLFSIGLMLVCTYKFDLFTGKVCYAKWSADSIDYIIFVYVINVVACDLMAVLTSVVKPELVKYAKIIVSRKLMEGWRVIPLSMLCGAFIFFAVHDFDKRDRVERYILLILCVMGFILTGSEHSIANMFYICLANPSLREVALYFLLNALGNAAGGILAYRLYSISGRSV